MLFKNRKEKREIKRLLRILKKLDHSSLRLFKTVPFDDQLHALEYLIISKLKERVLSLEHQLLDKQNKPSSQVQQNHINYLLDKLHKFPSRIEIFQTDFDEEEFKKIYALLDFIERDCKHV